MAARDASRCDRNKRVRKTSAAKISAKRSVLQGKACLRNAPYVALPFVPMVSIGIVGFLAPSRRAQRDVAKTYNFQAAFVPRLLAQSRPSEANSPGRRVPVFPERAVSEGTKLPNNYTKSVLETELFLKDDFCPLNVLTIELSLLCRCIEGGHPRLRRGLKCVYFQCLRTPLIRTPCDQMRMGMMM